MEAEKAVSLNNCDFLPYSLSANVKHHKMGSGPILYSVGDLI